ncbi:MAG: cupredoxin domain-containing protein [Patescibacteria group bacterium]
MNNYSAKLISISLLIAGVLIVSGMYIKGDFNLDDENSAYASNDSRVGQTKAIPSTTKPNVASCGGSAGGGCGGCGGGQKKVANANTIPVVASVNKDTTDQQDVQIIKATYTNDKYIDPSVFKVKAGVKVRFEIDVKDEGSGCGYAITIPGLYDEVVPLEAGALINMEFTPTTPGSYDITCGMEMINYGSIIVE